MNDYIRHIIREHPDCEIEARFGQYTNNGFVPGVNKTDFEIIKSHLESNNYWNKSLCVSSKDVYDGSNRNEYENNTLKRSIIKDRLSHKDFGMVRLSASVESECKPFKETSSCFVRTKKRWSFFHKYWRYDLTHVCFGNTDVYEIEIELVNHPSVLSHSTEHISDSFEMKINQIMRLLR